MKLFDLIKMTLFLSAFIVPVCSANDLYGIVIGANEYRLLKNLKGAVNDARDVAALLDELKAKKVRLLLNEEANRDAIFGAWNEITRLAKSGDTVVFYYAGHGSQEPEQIANSEADGKDEVRVLSDFDTIKPHNKERIRDKEFRSMFMARPDLNIIQVFDSCHSGTASRSASRSDLSMPSRYDDYGAIQDDALPPPPNVSIQDQLFENEYYVGGSEDGSLVTELPIFGEARGALTYAFTKGVRGDADQNSDGIITRGELAKYLRWKVNGLTGQNQPIALQFSGHDRPLFSVAPNSGKQTIPPLTIKVIPETMAGMNYSNAVYSGSHNEPDLIWDAIQGSVYKNGDLVANKISTHPLFQGEINRWYARLKIESAFGNKFFDSAYCAKEQPDHMGRYEDGELACVMILRRKYRFITILNLGPGGIVNHIFPVSNSMPISNDLNDHSGIADPKKTIEMHMPVIGPTFGAEQMLIIASEEKLSELHGNLYQHVDGKAKPIHALNLLVDALHGKDYQYSFVDVYTKSN